EGTGRYLAELAPPQLPVAVFRARQEEVIRVIAVGRVRRDIVRYLHEVAAHDVEFIVRTQHDTMRAVFTAIAGPFSNQFSRVVLVIAVGVTKTIEREAV